LGVMRADLGAEAILEGRDDPPAVRVVLGVRRRDDEEVERQADLVATDLHVALLHHVEEADLHALREVGQLVQGEDPAVRPQPAMAGTAGWGSDTRERAMRVFACPRSPRKMMSWPERMAFSICGTTVCS